MRALVVELQHSVGPKWVVLVYDNKDAAGITWFASTP